MKKSTLLPAIIAYIVRPHRREIDRKPRAGEYAFLLDHNERALSHLAAALVALRADWMFNDLG